MVDTLDLYYRFPSNDSYNRCFQVVDKISRQAGQAIHKDSEKLRYLTTAFAKMGILQMSFNSTYNNSCKMIVQPIRLLYPSSHLRLSRMEDFPTIINRLNEFLEGINTLAEEPILPSIESWNVVRIDYAYDIETPFVREYIRLIKAGYIPNGFRPYEDEEEDDENRDTSAYYMSANCNINIYDKLFQVRKF